MLSAKQLMGRGRILATAPFAAVHSCGFPFDRGASCSAGRERVIYIERLARSMGSDDDMFRIWSGPEGSSHKEPLSGIRIHRAHGLSFCAVLPNRAMLDAARHPERQFVIQKARHDQKVYALPFSCQLVRSGWRSLALPKHRWLRGSRGDGYLVSRWSSALPAGSLDYQTARRRRDHFVQKSPVKARLAEQFNPVLSDARWLCQNIGCYMPWALVTVALISVTSCLRISRVLRTIMNQIEER